MQYDIRNVARGVMRWTALGVELPKGLETAIDRFEALQFVEVGHAPVFEVDKVTPKNAEQKVREFAEVLANRIPLSIDGAHVSVLDTAKRWAVEEAAKVVKREAAQAIPQIVEQLEPQLESHAEAYSEAVLQLPDKVTNETLVSSGPDALTAYNLARAEADHINKIGSWINGTDDVLNISSGSEGFLAVLAPDDGIQLSQLDSANRGSQDRAFAAITPVYFTAVRLGVPFRINTLREARALRKELAFSPSKVNFA